MNPSHGCNAFQNEGFSLEMMGDGPVLEQSLQQDASIGSRRSVFTQDFGQI